MNVRSILETLQRFLENNSLQEESSTIRQFNAVEKARQDWLCAKNFFDEVEDPELVDLAIYAMKATEKKYVYLLKQARSGQLLADQQITG